MSNGEYEITEETFKAMKVEERQWMMFTTFNKYRDHTNKRIVKLEKRKKVDTAVAGIGGFVGGIVAVIMKKIIGQ